MGGYPGYSVGVRLAAAPSVSFRASEEPITLERMAVADGQPELGYIGSPARRAMCGARLALTLAPGCATFCRELPW